MPVHGPAIVSELADKSPTPVARWRTSRQPRSPAGAVACWRCWRGTDGA